MKHEIIDLDSANATSPTSIAAVDKLQSYMSAADALGLPYHKIQRAAARKLIPTYSLGDSKKYVRIGEIIEVMKATQQGGKHD